MSLGSGNGLVPGHNELTPRPVNGNETYVKGLVIIGLDNGLPPNTWSHNLNKGGFVQPVEFMMFYSRKYHWELSSERSTPCWSRERWVNLIGNISSSERQKTLWDSRDFYRQSMAPTVSQSPNTVPTASRLSIVKAAQVTVPLTVSILSGMVGIPWGEWIAINPKFITG